MDDNVLVFKDNLFNGAFFTERYLCLSVLKF